jgi:polar amino acid transport system ATP-binding protein
MQPVLLRVSNLRKAFRRAQALDGVYLDIRQREVVALIGRSGCGKSTLLRCISWLDEPDDGFIEVEGQPFGRAAGRGGVVQRQPGRQIAAMRPRLGLVFQQFHLWPHMTALENVVRAQVVVLRRPLAEAEAKARGLLFRLGLGARMHNLPHALSGGERQRVAIARALAMDPALMLFDEPTSALDPELVGEVLGVLRELADEGMTMLVVTHEIGFARRVADRIAFMEAGRIVADGPSATLLANPPDPRLAAFLARALPPGSPAAALPRPHPA